MEKSHVEQMPILDGPEPFTASRVQIRYHTSEIAPRAFFDNDDGGVVGTLHFEICCVLTSNEKFMKTCNCNTNVEFNTPFFIKHVG